MIVFAEIAIQRDIAQNIVHPAHVPFKIKAEAPTFVGFETSGQAVLSSAIISVEGCS